MSHPEIGLTQKSQHKEELNHNAVKRTQKDYSLSLKHHAVKEVESGELSIQGALRKYGIFDRELQVKLLWIKVLNKSYWNWKPKFVC